MTGVNTDKLSPMMQQYFQIKNQHKDHILMYRLGDFYEMFFDDALLASKELELTLTGRDCGGDERAPMCGVPYHSCDAYIARLIAKGYKVAICDQMEEPGLSKGPVRREVTRIITPGTVIEGAMLDEGKNNFIAAVFMDKPNVGLCFADVSTGLLEVCELSSANFDAAIISELSQFMPNELLLNHQLDKQPALRDFISGKLNCTLDIREAGHDQAEDYRRKALAAIPKERLGGLDVEIMPNAAAAVGMMMDYLMENHLDRVVGLLNVSVHAEDQYMVLDAGTRRNLELTSTIRTGEKRGSLLWVLDRTKTSMGKRLLRLYLEQPLCSAAMIQGRLNAVDELVGDALLRGELMDTLEQVFDLERLITRIVYGSANPREVTALAFTAAHLPELHNQLSHVRCGELKNIYDSIDCLTDIEQLVSAGIAEDPPVSIKDGGIIKDGFNKEIDELRDIVKGGKGYLRELEEKEKAATGISKLKVGYNRVFGYYFEVTKSNISLVPETYIRKQTLANCERFITPELKELEDKILGASDRLLRLEEETFQKIKDEIAEKASRVQRTASAIAKLDVLCSFAEVSVRNHYVRPEIGTGEALHIKNGRHPVVEKMLQAPFVPNDTVLDTGDNRVAIITGPNMAGKSTYMRQVAIITLMMQLGCFVPAESARLPIVDRIFTRIGASDDLAGGQSTFMVEMSEVAYILKNATRKSLILLDEIGRGTSTFDGMSIARAVLEYIADTKKIGAKTLFATHYHELTVLEELLPGVKNYNIAVKKRGDEIIFLRRIVAGGTDDSYGIEVAKLAGVPNPIIKRAYEILTQLEGDNPQQERKQAMSRPVQQPEGGQLDFGASRDSEVAERLRELDINVLTPIEALNLLSELHSLAGK